MSRQMLLSGTIGIPIALIALALLFWVEANHASARRSSFLLRGSTVVATTVLVVLVAARFAEYT